MKLLTISILLTVLFLSACDSSPPEADNTPSMYEMTRELHSTCYFHDDPGSTESIEACLELSRVDRRTDLIVLSERGLKKLPDSFHDLENVKKLTLDGNNLVDLPPSIGLLKGLEVLYLHRNDFEHVPESVLQLDTLKVLILGYNPIQALPDTIDRLRGLEVLHLQKVRKDIDLPPSIAKLNSLKVLDLQTTVLSKIPAAIYSLPNIEYLNLAATHLSELDPRVGTISTLKGLSIEENQITQLPETLGNLKNLIYLEASRNELHTAPESLTRIPGLTRYIDNHIGLVSQPFLSLNWADLPKLSEKNLILRSSGINLRSNNIEALPLSFCKVKHLKFTFDAEKESAFLKLCSGEK